MLIVDQFNKGFIIVGMTLAMLALTWSHLAQKITADHCPSEFIA